MKKLLKGAGIAFLVALSILDSKAQSSEAKGGLSFATVTGYRGSKFVPAFYLGLAHSITLSKHMNFHPEILYSLQGTKLDHSRYWYHYMQLPLFFDFRIGEKGGLLWGPQIGVLARAKARDSRNETSSLLPMMKPFDLSIGGGPYVKINDIIKAELRMSFGVVEISNKNESLRNFLIQVGVSVAINKPGDE